MNICATWLRRQKQLLRIYPTRSFSTRNRVVEYTFPKSAKQDSEQVVNKNWLLHPWLAIDVRVLAVLSAAGATAYYAVHYYDVSVGAALSDLANSAIRTVYPPPPKKSQLPIESGLHGQDEGFAQLVPTVTVVPEPQLDAMVVVEPLDSGIEVQVESVVPDDSSAAAETDESTAQRAEGTEEATSIDATIIPGFFTDALVGPSQSVAVDEASVDTQHTGQTEPQHDAQSTTQREQHADADDAALLTARTDAAARDLHGAAQQRPASQLERQDKKQVQDDVSQPTQGVLALMEGVVPADLVSKAVQQGLGAGDDWAAYRAAHQQATADVAFIEQLLRRAQSYHEEELAKAYAVAEKWAAKAEQFMQQAEEQANTFSKLFEKQRAFADAQRDAELQRQAVYFATAAAEAAVRERTERHRIIDGLRERVNIVNEVLQRHARNEHARAFVNDLCLAVSGLATALQRGTAFDGELARVASFCGHDTLVSAALRCIPADAAKGGVPTQSQLIDEWNRVRATTRTLALMPPHGGGWLSYALSRVASALKVNERYAADRGVTSGTIDGVVATVESHILRGDMRAAALTLERGVQNTAAAHAVEPWVEAAKARAIVDQSVVLLQAHARAVAYTVA